MSLRFNYGPTRIKIVKGESEMRLVSLRTRGNDKEMIKFKIDENRLQRVETNQ